jgi:hypothetical protein
VIVAVGHLGAWLAPARWESQPARNKTQRIDIQGWLYEQILYGHCCSFHLLLWISVLVVVLWVSLKYAHMVLFRTITIFLEYQELQANQKLRAVSTWTFLVSIHACAFVLVKWHDFIHLIFSLPKIGATISSRCQQVSLFQPLFPHGWMCLKSLNFLRQSCKYDRKNIA